MEDAIKKNRRENLAHLAKAAGSNAELARRLGRADALVNNYLNKKPMGRDFARHVEEVFGLDYAALDRAYEGTPPWLGGSLAPQPAPAGELVEDVVIKRYDVRASMGIGIPLPEREPVIDSIRVPMEYVRENLPHITSPRNLRIVTGHGDSMKPTFNHADPLIVDIGVKTMDIDTIYVFTYQDELYIKRIQRLPDRSIKVISDNRAMYDPFILDAKQREDVKTLARVICAVNMNKIS